MKKPTLIETKSIETMAREAIALDAEIKEKEAKFAALKKVILDQIGEEPVLIADLGKRVCKRVKTGTVYDVAAIGNIFAKAKQLPAFFSMVNVVAGRIPKDITASLRAGIEANAKKGVDGKPFIVIEDMSAANEEQVAAEKIQTPKKKRA